MGACGVKKAERALHSVMVTTPQTASGMVEKNFSGVVHENAVVSLSFRVDGQVAQVLVKAGDHVRRGQLVARLDAKDYQLSMEAVQIQYDQTAAEVERLRMLYEGKSLSGNDYEKALSGLRQLAVQLQGEKNRLSYTNLYAPQDGIVQRVNIEPGEMSGAGTPVMTLLDTHRMEVEVNLPQSVCRQRDSFSDIWCTAEGRQYPLHLITIIPKADNNQLYMAKMRLDEPLTAGQTVDVVIRIVSHELSEGMTSSNSKRYLIPLHAIFEDGGKSCVWTVGKDSAVHRHEVQTAGIDKDGHAIVSSGLDGTETIVRAGVDVLTESEKVKIINEDE